VEPALVAVTATLAVAMVTGAWSLGNKIGTLTAQVADLQTRVTLLTRQLGGRGVPVVREEHRERRR
jgi:hypothetical protein